MIKVMSLFCWKFKTASFCSEDAFASENAQQNKLNTSIMIDVNYTLLYLNVSSYQIF